MSLEPRSIEQFVADIKYASMRSAITANIGPERNLPHRSKITFGIETLRKTFHLERSHSDRYMLNGLKALLKSFGYGKGFACQTMGPNIGQVDMLAGSIFSDFKKSFDSQLKLLVTEKSQRISALSIENGSMVHRDDVRKEVADLVVLTEQLDLPIAELFEKVKEFVDIEMPLVIGLPEFMENARNLLSEVDEYKKGNEIPEELRTFFTSCFAVAQTVRVTLAMSAETTEPRVALSHVIE